MVVFFTPLRTPKPEEPLIDAPVRTEIIGEHGPAVAGERIIHRGPVVLRDILHDYDALLLPDPRPEHARPVLEAMAVGLPILGAPAPWLEELTIGCGALGPDVPALVERLAADPAQYRCWSAAASERVRTRYSRPAPTAPRRTPGVDRYPGQDRLLRAGGYLYAGSTQAREPGVDSRTRVPSGWTSDSSGLARLASSR